jgi:hypothetical protein
MPMLAVPFSLSLAKESSVDGAGVQSKVYQVRGMARLDGDRLTLEWSGSVDIVEVRGKAGVRTMRQSVPAQRLVLPVSRITLFEPRGRWWKPHIELRTDSIAPLELMPTAMAGRVVLRIARSDWASARELASHVQLAMADAALHGAERARPLPSHSQSAEPGADRSR